MKTNALNILIVDDDPLLCAGLKAMINKRAGCCNINEACDGKEALSLLEQGNIDLVITDIKMPVMNGLSLLKEAVARKIRAKFIVLSGYDDFDFVREALLQGAVDYLLKPVDPDILAGLLEKAADMMEMESRKVESEKQMKDIVDKSMSMLKDRVLKGILGLNNDYFDMEQVNDLGIQKAKSYYILVFKYFHSSDQQIRSAQNMNSFRQNLLSLTFDISSKLGFLDTIVNEDVVLFYFSPMDSEEMNNLIRNNVGKLYQKAVDIGASNVSIGMSGSFDNLSDSFRFYEKADYAVKKGFYVNHTRIFHEQIEKFNLASCMDKEGKNMLAALREAIEKYDYVAARSACQALEEKSFSIKVDPDELKRCIVGIIQNMAVESYEFEEALSFYNMTSSTKAVETLQGSPTCSCFFYLLNNIVKQTINTMIDIQKGMSKDSIEVAKAYISQHYHEDISLKKLADYVHLNQNYLSELFKSTTGKNYITYLTETRIAVAKKMLLDPNIKVYEVAEKVGYEEPVSFNKAFKKVVGVSPAEYKKSVKLNL